VDRDPRPPAPRLLAHRPGQPQEDLRALRQPRRRRALCRPRPPGRQPVGALEYVRDPQPETLRKLLGMAPLPTPAQTPAPCTPEVAPPPPGVPTAGVTFAVLWERFLQAQRHLEGTTAEDYESYGQWHLLPFFGAHDLAVIKRSRPLRDADAVPGAVYVDDWVTQMLAKERRNNVGRPIAGSVLSIKFIRNVLAVLGQCFDFAIEQRPAPIEVNPARGIRLPKQDRREMHFLQDEQAYLELRYQMHAHFQPVLDFSSAPVHRPAASGLRRRRTVRPRCGPPARRG